MFSIFKFRLLAYVLCEEVEDGLSNLPLKLKSHPEVTIEAIRGFKLIILSCHSMHLNNEPPL
jgi:hypothetical protein